MKVDFLQPENYSEVVRTAYITELIYIFIHNDYICGGFFILLDSGDCVPQRCEMVERAWALVTQCFHGKSKIAKDVFEKMLIFFLRKKYPTTLHHSTLCPPSLYLRPRHAFLRRATGSRLHLYSVNKYIVILMHTIIFYFTCR